MERYFHLGARNPWRGGEVFPRGQGPFVRAAREAPDAGRELVVGQWGLVPWFAKTPKLTYSTNNARAEELAVKATFKHPWARGQRCIIPACWRLCASAQIWLRDRVLMAGPGEF